MKVKYRETSLSNRINLHIVKLVALMKYLFLIKFFYNIRFVITNFDL